MTTSSDSSAQSDAQRQIIDRAASDPEFRAELLANPKEAISRQLGIPLPANINVRVIEEQPGEVILVLPARAMQSGSTLSDADLEAVAGGSTGWGGAQWGGDCVG